MPRAFSLLLDGHGWVRMQIVGDLLVGVGVAPLTDDVGQERHAGAEDERQPSSLQGDLVGLRDHARISDHGDVGESDGLS